MCYSSHRKTSNDVGLRGRDVGSGESTRTVGCGGNVGVEVDRWSRKAG